MNTSETFNIIKEKFIKDTSSYFDNKSLCLNKQILEFENYYFKYVVVAGDLFHDCNEEEILLLTHLGSIGLTFDSINQSIISKSNIYNLLYTKLIKREYSLRYSKKYNLIECKLKISFIKEIKSKKKVIINKEVKLFTINKNNRVKVFKSGLEVKYISLKNFKKFDSHINLHCTLKKLLQIHLNSTINIYNLIEQEVQISNFVLYGRVSIDDALLSIYNNFEIEKYEIDNKIKLLEMLSLIDKKFHYEFILFFEKYYSEWNYEQGFNNFKKIVNYNYYSTFVVFFISYYYKIITIQENKCFYSYMSIEKIIQIDRFITHDSSNKHTIFNKSSYYKFKTLLMKKEINTFINSLTFKSEKNKDIIKILKLNFDKVNLLNSKELMKIIPNYFQGNFIKNNNTKILFETIYKNTKFLILVMYNIDYTYGENFNFICYFNIFDNISNNLQMEISNMVANLKTKNSIKIFEKEEMEKQNKYETVDFDDLL